jgi:DNA-directed RNA polymerase subunit M/transcription elongation factor TFIIS
MFNYDNIGNKIKGLAQMTFVVEAIAAVITGIALMASDEDLILYGLLVLIAGPIIAWVSSWLLYGFGQLIENSDIIAEEYNRKNEKHEKVVEKNNERKQEQRKKAIKATIVNPEISEDEFIDIACPNCKAELSYPKRQLQSEDGVTCPMCDAHISV